MRVVFELRPRAGELVLPLHYHSLLQGLVYNLMAGSEVAEFLHDQGFRRGARRYKLFTFSRLEGSYEIVRWNGRGESDRAAIATGDEPATGPAGAGAPAGSEGSLPGHPQCPAHRRDRFIRYSGGVRFTLSSPYAPVCHVTATRALQEGEVRLGTQAAEVDAVRFEELPRFSVPVRIRARTPITVYSTLNRPDGSRFTYFFEPRSGEFERLVAENLVRKWEAFTGRPYDGPGMRIRWRGPARGHVVRFRHGIVKGYTGWFEADGDAELIALGLEAGFGSKNAQGFGLCDLVQPAPLGRAQEHGRGTAQGAD